MKILLMIIAIVAGTTLMPQAVRAGTVQEANKKTVLAFYEKAINQKDFEAAFELIIYPSSASRYSSTCTRSQPDRASTNKRVER